MKEDQAEKFLIRWNNENPFDKWWRDKHSIPFGSKKHLEIDDISQTLEYYEDKLFEKYHYEGKRRKKELEEYDKTGVWLKERKSSLSEEEANRLIDEIPLEAFNNTDSVKFD